MEIRDFRNVHEMLKETVDRYSDRTAYRSIDDNGEMDGTTWTEFYGQVRQAGKSLIALGVGTNDKVNILSYSNYRWVLTDLANMSIGSCAVGIYHSLLAKDVRHIVQHSDAVLVFAEDEGQVAKMLEIKAEVPEVRKVILFSGTPPADDWVISYEEFLDLGTDVPDEDLESRIANVEPSDVATIVAASPSSRANSYSASAPRRIQAMATRSWMIVTSSWRKRRPSRMARRKSSRARRGSSASLPRATHDLARSSIMSRFGTRVSMPSTSKMSG